MSTFFRQSLKIWSHTQLDLNTTVRTSLCLSSLATYMVTRSSFTSPSLLLPPLILSGQKSCTRQHLGCISISTLYVLVSPSYLSSSWSEPKLLYSVAISSRPHHRVPGAMPLAAVCNVESKLGFD